MIWFRLFLKIYDLDYIKSDILSYLLVSMVLKTKTNMYFKLRIVSLKIVLQLLLQLWYFSKDRWKEWIQIPCKKWVTHTKQPLLICLIILLLSLQVALTVLPIYPLWKISCLSTNLASNSTLKKMGWQLWLGYSVA